MNTKEVELLNEIIKMLRVSSEKFSHGFGSSNTWLDISETCKWLKISPRTLQSYRDKGLIPYSQVGAKIYFRLEDLQEFLMKYYDNSSMKGRRV